MNAVIFGSSVLLGLGFAATIVLYLGLRRELRAWLREQQRKEAALGAEIHELRAKLQRTAAGAGSERSPLPNDPAATGCVVRWANGERHRADAALAQDGNSICAAAPGSVVPRVSEEVLAAKLEGPAHAPAPSSTPRVSSGINMSKRIQAIRMLRRGENSASIAAALGMSRREVELLIRVHRMSADRAVHTVAAG